MNIKILYVHGYHQRKINSDDLNHLYFIDIIALSHLLKNATDFVKIGHKYYVIFIDRQHIIMVMVFIRRPILYVSAQNYNEQIK